MSLADMVEGTGYLGYDVIGSLFCPFDQEAFFQQKWLNCIQFLINRQVANLFSVSGSNFQRDLGEEFSISVLVKRLFN